MGILCGLSLVFTGIYYNLIEFVFSNNKIRLFLCCLTCLLSVYFTESVFFIAVNYPHLSYRWWPAKICFPEDVPDRILALCHSHGEFPVMFFGSRDYAWLHSGRVFRYEEGDKGGKLSKRNSLGNYFTKGYNYYLFQTFFYVTQDFLMMFRVAVYYAISLLKSFLLKMIYSVRRSQASICRIEDGRSTTIRKYGQKES